MTKRKLILHIGTEKTGTTSIQSALVKNRDKLENNNYFFPMSLGPRSQVKLANYALADGVISNLRIMDGIHTSSDVIPYREKVEKELAAELQRTKASTVVMSNEHCSSRLVSLVDINRLKHFLSDYFDDIKIVVYLRQQESFLSSWYSTSVKNGNSKKIPNALNFRNNNMFNYDLLLQKWEQVFGKNNIILKIFEKEDLENGDVVEDFFKLLNISDFKNVIVSNNALSLKKI